MRNSLENKKIKKYPKWFYAVAIIVPIVLVVLFELLLNFLNYGTDYSTFVKISDQFENYKFFNPNLPTKYFGNSPVTPSVIPDGFKKTKNENTYRIFVLGGSTTAGFPHPPNGSFPRILKDFLQIEYPFIEFEVINLGISAVNSITLRDIIDEVLNEDPDLIIIYAGHNEYYGALGISSNISSYNNLFIIRLALNLKEYRTFQLFENFIAELFSVLKSEKKLNKTLMSEFAGDKLVAFESSDYQFGISQFESNLEYLLSQCSQSKVPALVGTLVSNLMQEPLCKFSGCDSLVFEYELVIQKMLQDTKNKLYRIKDKDQLRFRAPEKFNEIIFNLSQKYNSHVFDVQKLFEDKSHLGIIGNNLMMDHLHPTFNGNKLIAKLLNKRITEEKLIKQNSFRRSMPAELINNSLNFLYYTKLDSIFAELRIRHLKSDFPFVKEKLNIAKPYYIEKTLEDSLAQSIISGKISWENAHLKLANSYLLKNDYYNYVNEINVLIQDKPFDKFPYLTAIKDLENAEQTELLIYILKKYYSNIPDIFAAKKLGNIYYNQKKYIDALFFYKKLLEIYQNDAEIYFNISAIYFANKDLQKALENIQKCISINPDYPNAKKIFNTLKKIYQDNHK